MRECDWGGSSHQTLTPWPPALFRRFSSISAWPFKGPWLTDCADLRRRWEPFRELKHAWPNMTRKHVPGVQRLHFSTLIVNKAVGKSRVNPRHSARSAAPTQTWNLLSHWPLSRIGPLTRVTPPIGSFHSATMAARGCVIWGSKEPSQPPAPGTMDTPTNAFFSSPF